MTSLPVILDVDTGVDDALAILFAVAHPDINVLGISCVAGNASLERVVDNTLRILDVAGAGDIPVAAGARRPLIEAARDASHVHGESGLGTLHLPETEPMPVPGSSIELMHRLITESPQPVTLIALAPQTNLALLLRQYPDDARNIERIVFMGGSASVGNSTAVAEFNVWHDPEAAAIVLDSGVPTYMYGLDVFNRVGVDEAVATALLSHETARGRAVGALIANRVTSRGDSSSIYSGLIGDAGAVCAIVNPGAVQTQIRPVRVQLSGYGRGQTLVDLRQFPGEDVLHGVAEEWASVEVALDIDVDSIIATFLETLDLA